MNIIEKYNNQFEYAGIIMNILITIQFLKLWYMPALDDADKIVTMAGLMIFEFFMVHSGVFMAGMPKRISLFVFVPFYGIFAFAFNSLVADNLILISYLLVVINRMRFAFSDVNTEDRVIVLYKSRQAAISYIILIFPLAYFASYVPPLGLTDDFLSQSGYRVLQEGKGGLFIDKPHIPMVFGFLYYIKLSYWEYRLIQNPESIVDSMIKEEKKLQKKSG